MNLCSVVVCTAKDREPGDEKLALIGTLDVVDDAEKAGAMSHTNHNLCEKNKKYIRAYGVIGDLDYTSGVR